MPIIGSFADIAGQWLESEKHKVTTVTHTKKTARLKNLAFPVLGDMPIKQIKPSDVLASLKPIIDRRQLETAHRLHGEIENIFDYGIVHNQADYREVLDERA
ncbi:MAG: hypothetical protein ABL919_08525 [Methylococcales bacterium]